MRTITKILDHGSVELIAHCANDESVIQAMLVSTGKDFEFGDDFMPDEETEAKNRGRINFLMKNKHGTPFEHNYFRFRICAPIFVVREWHRHRIGWSYNEISGRYTQLGDKWYIPSRQDVRTRVGKPGHYVYEPLMHSVGGDETITLFLEQLNDACRESYQRYLDFLDEGVSPEQARAFLHVNHYTSFYASCNARSLMAFLELRNASTAQWEIQQYARALEEIAFDIMPATFRAFVENGRVAP